MPSLCFSGPFHSYIIFILQKQDGVYTGPDLFAFNMACCKPGLLMQLLSSVRNIFNLNDIFCHFPRLCVYFKNIIKERFIQVKFRRTKCRYFCRKREEGLHPLCLRGHCLFLLIHPICQICAHHNVV